MRTWFYAWKRKARFTIPKAAIVDALPANATRTADSDFEMTDRGRIIHVRYEWTIRPDDDAFVVTEEAFLSRSWFLLLAVTVLGLLLGFTGLQHLHGVGAVGAMVVTLLLLCLFVALFVVFTRHSATQDDLFVDGDRHQELIPLVSLILLLLPALGAGFVLDAGGRVVVLVGIGCLFGGYERFHDRVVEQSVRWQSWVVSLTTQLPLVAANYLASLVLGATVLLVFLGTYDAPRFLSLTARWPVLAPLLFAGLVVLMLDQVRRTVQTAWVFETSRYETHGRNVERTRTLVVTGSLVVIISVGFGYLAYQFLRAAVVFLQVIPTIGTVSYVVLAGVPIWYLAAGFLFQGYSLVHNMHQLVTRASHEDLEHILDVDAETHVVEHDALFAGAVSLGFENYILLSRGLLEELSSEEVAAIMAHEESHLRHRDAVLGLVLALLSPVFLTGKNVLYAIFDYRAREFRADADAARRVDDPEQLLQALDSLQVLLARQRTAPVSGITPTLLPFEQSQPWSRLRRLFGFYFGNFAMTRVHPTLEERKRQLRSEIL